MTAAVEKYCQNYFQLRSDVQYAFGWYIQVLVFPRLCTSSHDVSYIKSHCDYDSELSAVEDGAGDEPAERDCSSSTTGASELVVGVCCCGAKLDSA